MPRLWKNIDTTNKKIDVSADNFDHLPQGKHLQNILSISKVESRVVEDQAR